MNQHWEDFRDLANSINLTDKTTLLQYAYHGLAVSFSRGVVDRFFKGETNPFGDEAFEPIKEFQGVPLAIDIVTKPHDYPDFVDLGKCGNYMVHKFTHLGQSVSLETFAYWMLNIRLKLVRMNATLDAKLPGIQASTSSRLVKDKNTEVRKFWKNALKRFNAITEGTHGPELASFLTYGSEEKRDEAKSNVNAAKACIELFKRAVPHKDNQRWGVWYFSNLHVTKPSTPKYKPASGEQMRINFLKVMKQVRSKKIDSSEQPKESSEVCTGGLFASSDDSDSST